MTETTAEEEGTEPVAQCLVTVGHFGDIRCELVAGHKWAHVAKAGDTTYTWGGMGRLYESQDGTDGKG